MTILQRAMLCFAILAFTGSLGAAPELVAIGTIGGKAYFVLRDRGSVSPWLVLGDTYRGQALARYDNKTLVLRGRDGEVALTLTVPHVRDAADANPFHLASGTREIKDGKIIYSADAMLTFNQQMLHAASGHLESDAATPGIVRGNIVMLTKHGIVVAGNATYDSIQGKLVSSTTWFGSESQFEHRLSDGAKK